MQSESSPLTKPPESVVNAGSARDGLRATRFDRVTSFLMALMLLIGTFVTVLIMLWMLDPSREFDRKIDPQVPPRPAADVGDLEITFEAPGSEEVVALIEPTIHDAISAVKLAANVNQVLDSSIEVHTNRGDANDIGRNPGPETDSRGSGGEPEIVPRFQRWQLNFAARDIRTYAAQLDFHQIELGVVGGSIQGIDAVNQLSTRPTARRIVDTATEKRLYFMWTHPTPLARFDRELLSRTGVQLDGRQMLRFVPPDLENRLARAELEYAMSHGHESVAAVAKTIFESKSVDDQYRFEVIDQRYR